MLPDVKLAKFDENDYKTGEKPPRMGTALPVGTPRPRHHGSDGALRLS